ncbi:ABC transporter ATP-binding protein [Demequina sp. SYSU T00039]|uniref:ABC transporter ATP-binding protein n=1 Tax=Demequina lignilytica TaxID=3051663 RepID=A0AAW7M1H6_9MICO|nr:MULTISPECIES: ABC transporter ATP-binding protein [unclassified Demequina]MDN4478077.1 ABC transporter ATP-binding protein [Demequina sp. SYSU T00039-1]MDN4488473.1 ABC transporter ATP-binding protein [Demequina sp. SYSU T00039]MDN4489980.1 ABC transporter ATP-binding protein [Demequina sp. SYSU T00068]
MTTVTLAASMRGGTKDYGSGDTAVRALDGVNVDIARHEFTAIMGPSGSGKSTLLHTLAGLDRLTAGESSIADIVITSLPEAKVTEVRREHIGFVFQSFNLIPSLTGRENITLPLDISGKPVDPAWFDEIIGILGLGDRLTHLPAELSGGQQQRVAVARALVARPEIIFADEPSGNLDSRSGAELLGFMRRAVKEFGQTIVMVTHDPTAASYADRILFLEDGQIVDEMREPTADRVLDRMKQMGH